MTNPDSRITQLLQSVDPRSAQELLPLVYEDLRRLARARLSREKPGHTLQPTALVHEAFLRLAPGRDNDQSWDGRRHFYAAAAEAMRRILINQARRKAQIRHGGATPRVDLEGVDIAIEAPSVDLLAIEEALTELEAADPRAREVVNLRYFVGLTTAETADVLGISVSTVEREWRFLRTFLQESLGDAEES